jgi:hypothetical protein
VVIRKGKKGTAADHTLQPTINTLGYLMLSTTALFELQTRLVLYS